MVYALADLNETNEELQALVLTRHVEEGINLLNGTSNSLAQELHDMSQSQVRSLYRRWGGLFVGKRKIKERISINLG